MPMKNFAWIATWKITRRCNLRCVYCDHAIMRTAAHKETVDYEKVIRNIRAYSPKILNISGGEPTLVESLPGILSEIKMQWDPFIRIVHNGTDPEKLINCLPHIDRLVVSLDGPDPINTRTRGIGTEAVFKKLKEVLPEIFNHRVEVGIHCVVTTTNLSSIQQLAREVRGLSPAITVCFSPVMPADGKLSIVRDEKLFNEFLATYHELKKQGFRVMHVFDTIMYHGDFKHIQCYNQYFTIRIMPEGQVITCAMNEALNSQQYSYYFKKLFSGSGIKKALNRIKKKVKQNIFSTIDFSCTTLCACEGWLDLIFLGIASDCIAAYARGLSGRMTNADYKTAEAFVRRHINQKFNALTMKNIIDAPSQPTHERGE